MALRKLKKKKTVQPKDVAYPELEEMLRTMSQMIHEGLEHKQRFFQLEAAVLKFMEDHGLDTYERGPWKGTTVYGSTDQIDWEGIRKAIGPQRWSQILAPPQPDKALLEAHVQIGLVKPEEIAQFITGKPSKPYVKLTRRS